MIPELIQDFSEALASMPDAVSRRPQLDTLRRLLVLTSKVLRDDPDQLRPQLRGRLLGREDEATDSLLRVSRRGALKPWLRPLVASLESPSTDLVCQLMGHTDPIRAVALTSDASRAISTSGSEVCLSFYDRPGETYIERNTVGVWDTRSGLPIHLIPLDMSDAYLDTVTVLPGDRQFVLAFDAELIVFDLESGVEVRRLTGHTGRVVSVVSTEGRLVSASEGGEVFRWEADRSRTPTALCGRLPGLIGLTPCAGGRIAVLLEDRVEVLDWRTGDRLATLGAEAGGRRCCLMRDGRRMVIASPDRAEIRRIHDGSVETRLTGDLGLVLAAIDGESGPLLITEEAGAIGCVRLAVPRESPRRLGGAGEVRVTAVDGTGRHMLTGSKDGIVRLWSLRSTRSGKETHRSRPAPHRGRVTGLTVSPSGGRAATAGADGSLRIWNPATGELCATISTLSERGSVAGILEMTPAGNRVVAAARDLLYVLNVESGEFLRFVGHHRDVHGLVLDPRGRFAASVSPTNRASEGLLIWNLETGHLIRTLSPGRSRSRIAMSPDGARIGAASRDAVRVWCASTGRELAHLEPPGPPPAALVRLSSSLRLLACVQTDGHITVIEVDTGREVQRDRFPDRLGLAAWAGILIFSRRDRTVIASLGSEIVAWDLPSGDRLWSCRETSRRLWDATDENLLIAGGMSLVVRSRQDGHRLCSFSADREITGARFACGGSRVIAGDAGGRIHFLSLECQPPRDDPSIPGR